MQLESIEHIEALWSAESQRAQQRGPQDDFPRLPEIPSGRYTDEAFYGLEVEHVWKTSWLYAGILDELPEAGSYKRFSVLGIPLLLVRGSDDVVRAFHNTCQHRGALLVHKDCGRASGLVCPYHAWTYNLEGALRFVPDEHDFPGLKREEKGLPELRCETFGRLIYVSFALGAEPLKEYLGGLTQVLSDVPFHDIRLYRSISVEVDCNWKCVHDAFSETYHVRCVHNGSVNVAINPAQTARFMFRNGHNGMVVKNRLENGASAYANVFDRSGPRQEVRLKALTGLAQRSYNIFPNLTNPIAENIFPLLAAWPLGVGRCRVDVHFFKIAPDLTWDTEADRQTVESFHAILLEDISVLNGMQKALAGGGIRAMSLCRGEQFIYNFHRELDRRIGAQRIPEHLAVQKIDVELADGRG